MSIQMIGIDHTKAVVDMRAVFSFTKKKSEEAMERLTEQAGIKGAIILSTCNRMELWVSVEENWQGDLYRELCIIKQVNPAHFLEYFMKRKEEAAVRHLFHVASGMKSQILGEDQIITQVKESLKLSRECGCVDSSLEVLFRMAVTAAKKVKTQVVFPKSQTSAVDQAIEQLQKERKSERNSCKDLQGTTCMVIGNGEMGKASARAFRDAGAHVCMTVRQYRHGEVDIPEGCDRIPYENRGDYLEEMDYIVSATTSPHYTLTKEMFAGRNRAENQILIDLAVPRDIEPDIGDLENRQLYGIDDFASNQAEHGMKLARQEVEAILEEQEEEFFRWYNGRDFVPRIQQIKEDAAEDVCMRLKKPVRKLELKEQAKELLTSHIEASTEKMMNKMLFHLKERLDEETFAKCISALEHSFEDE